MLVVGCSSDTFVGGDGGDPGDGAQGNDSISESDGSSDGGVNQEGSPTDGAGGDGYDGYTLPSYRRVFITSKTYTSNFGGLSFADKACGDAATSAGLGGHWAAWLSTKVTSAASRLEHATVPYQLLDGTPIAVNWTALTFGTLMTSINMNEYGKAVPVVYYTSGFAWTGTNPDGTTSTKYTDDTCSDWTFASTSDDSQHEGACGMDSIASDAAWTAYVSYCEIAATLSFYCIEQP